MNKLIVIKGGGVIDQILYGQYYIWDIFGFFLSKKQLNDGNHGQGTHSAKMGSHSLAENTYYKYSRQLICPIGPKVWELLKKGLLGCS